MGTAKKEKKEKAQKHKHRHEEKAAAAAATEQQLTKSAKKHKKQQQAGAAAARLAEPPPPAAAAAGSSDTSSSDSDSDVQMQDAPAAPRPAAATAAKKLGAKSPAAAAAAGAKGTGKTLPEVLAAEGFVACQVAGAQCELDLRGIDNPQHKELWVLRLPDGVSVDSLHGRHIHIPGKGLPETRHLQPPPNPFSDPRADLLSYVQSAVPSQEVGHVSIGAEAAKRTGNHQHRELLQQHEFEAMAYSVVAAVPPAAGSSGSSGSSSGLKLLKVGRFIQLASDTALVDKKRMRQVSSAGTQLWGASDGWDGVLLPRHKPRRRLGGWKVQGGSNGSSGDEEFEEVVFLQPGEEAESDSDSGADSDSEQRQQQQGQGQQELYPRFYSDDESEEECGRLAGRQLQGQEEDRALPGGMNAPFMADLQQWVVSLPVDAKTLHQQQQTAQQYSTAQWAADRRAWWGQPPQNTYLAPSNTAAQDKLLQHLAELKDKPSSSSDSDSDSDSEDDVGATQQGGAASAPGSSGGADVNPDDIIVMEEGGDESSSDEEDESEEEEAAAAAGGKKGAVAGYPCALPLTYLLTLPKQVEEALSGVRGVRRRQRLRNAAVLLFTDWREVWGQIDKSMLTDDELWQLTHALPAAFRQQIQAQPDLERMRRMIARRQQAKTLGQQMVVAPPGPRPHYTSTDAGYAPYQAAGEKRVAAGSDAAGASNDEDAEIAQWLVEQGAGQRPKLLGAGELRGRGLEWDTDPGSLAREGLHVVLPDGRDVHIPAGTSNLDWQGELRRAWGF